ncbi:MAG: LapA family protein [Hyphomicrobium sp.]|nr:LapA family protein [Hyphomicrobium sp.]
MKKAVGPHVLKRILTVLIALPVAAALITLAVANRHAVTLALDPFNPSAPLVSLSLPFYVYLLGALTLGVILGGFSTWMSQARWRRRARNLSAEARRWQSEADRLARERDASIAGRGRDLPAPETERDAA